MFISERTNILVCTLTTEQPTIGSYTGFADSVP